MNISVKGILLSMLAMLIAAVVFFSPFLLIYGKNLNVYQLPLFPSLLVLCVGILLNLFGGFVLAKMSAPNAFFLSAVVLSGVFALSSLKAGILWFALNIIISCVLMFVGKMFAKR